ncbi:hypothetical protein D3C87_2198000 [compost metagenome]
MIAKATAGDVVSANPRCMSTSSERHTRMSVANDTCLSSQPKPNTATMPPIADAAVRAP